MPEDSVIGSAQWEDYIVLLLEYNPVGALLGLTQAN